MMKLIDASGRVFGKINVIDFCCLVLVGGMGALLVAGRMHLRITSPRDTVYYRLDRPVTLEEYRSAKQAEILPQRLDVEVLCPDLSTEEAALLKPGERELDAQGRVRLEIVQVGPPAPYTRPIDLGGVILARPVPGRWQVAIKVRLHGALDGRRFFFKDIPLQIGGPVAIVIQGRPLSGNVTGAALPKDGGAN